MAKAKANAALVNSAKGYRCQQCSGLEFFDIADLVAHQRMHGNGSAVALPPISPKAPPKVAAPDATTRTRTAASASADAKVATDTIAAKVAAAKDTAEPGTLASVAKVAKAKAPKAEPGYWMLNAATPNHKVQCQCRICTNTRAKYPSGRPVTPASPAKAAKAPKAPVAPKEPTMPAKSAVPASTAKAHSMLSAALAILGTAPHAMTDKALYAASVERGLIAASSAATPAATLGSKLHTLAADDSSNLVKVAAGLFGLTGTASMTLPPSTAKVAKVRDESSKRPASTKATPGAKAASVPSAAPHDGRPGVSDYRQYIIAARDTLAVRLDALAAQMTEAHGALEELNAAIEAMPADAPSDDDILGLTVEPPIDPKVIAREEALALLTEALATRDRALATEAMATLTVAGIADEYGALALVAKANQAA